LLVANDEISTVEEQRIHELVAQIELDYTCVFSLLLLTPVKQQWHWRGSSLWLNIQTDGIWLWSADDRSLADQLAWSRRFTPNGAFQMTAVQYDEIRIHMEHAAEDLAIAELLINSWKERAAIGHCYYAAFYAASALLLTKGISRAKHSGVKSALGLHFFKTGILPAAWSKLYEKLQAEREAATYDMAYEPGKQVAVERLRWANEFVALTRNYLIENGFLK